jgi:RHS repeat-associated protein
MTMSTAVNTTYFVGTHYEVTDGIVTKYYYAGSQRIAMKKDGVLNFIIGDHLGSTSLVTDANGAVVNETKYKAWGETRYSSGTEQTKYQYTGQYSYASDFGLHFYNARWYDSSLSRFTSADTIIPSGIQGLDRYAYVNNSPVMYTDPSGHSIDCGIGEYGCNAGNYTPPPPSDPVELTHAGDQAVTEDGKPFTRIRGGAEVYALYQQYRVTCGWWNNYVCDASSTFGIAQFIGMYILFESDSNTNLANILVTIFAQNLYVGGNNPAACGIGGVCANGAFNFIAANIDGSSGLLKGPLNDSIKIYDRNTPKLGSAADIRDLISRLGRSALDSNSVVIWDRKNGPSKWGNIKG